MANNKQIRDGNAQLFTTKTTESAGVNTPHVNIDSIPLATNASTEAKQDAGNTSLSSIDNKTPDLENGHVPIAFSSVHYFFSTLNSTEAQLPSLDVFTGGIDDIVIYPAVSILCKSDQNGILTIRQFIDALGAEECNVQSFEVFANIPNAFSYPINGNYFQAEFKNTGLVATKKFRLDIAYGAIEGATRRNNAPVAVNEVAGNVVKDLFRTTFANTIVGGVDPSFFNPITVGTGQAIGQSSGNLVLTSGTTANADTILRSTQSFYGSMLLRAQTILSQRIINNNFFVELVDVIGDNLAVTINSATSITVTIPDNPFNSFNVGQSMYIGNLRGFTGATAISGRYAIASVSLDDVTFTTVGFVLGSVNTGTCSLFGWNHYKLLYNGTTATSALYDAQRRGWSSGDTTVTINTTTGVGHMAILQNDEGNAYMLDQLVASSATLQPTARASRVINLPEENTPLFLQIRIVNGTTAPASTTTWSLGTISVENFSALPITVNNIKAQGLGNTMPVNVQNTVPVTLSSTTITSISAGTNLVGDFGLQVRANATGAATPVNINSPATPVGQIIKASAGRILSVNLTNSNASARFLKVFNATSVTMGTTSAAYEIAIPPSFNPLNISLPLASAATTGIVVAITGARGLTDNTAITANDVTGFITFA
jgi:hypothetical protein